MNYLPSITVYPCPRLPQPAVPPVYRLALQHAYYLQYKNVRPDYLKAIWKVVNWGNVESRLAAATK